VNFGQPNEKDMSDANRTRKPIGYIVTLRYEIGVTDKLNGIDVEERLVYLKKNIATEAYLEAEEFGKSCVEVENRAYGSVSDRINYIGVTEVMPVWESVSHLNEIGFREIEGFPRNEILGDVLSIEDIRDSSTQP
jgi:hypothetical protein